jgi:hypothetical protein
VEIETQICGNIILLGYKIPGIPPSYQTSTPAAGSKSALCSAPRQGAKRKIGYDSSVGASSEPSTSGLRDSDSGVIPFLFDGDASSEEESEEGMTGEGRSPERRRCL